MKGYQLTFFTQQDRRHGAQALSEWLIDEAKRLGIQGATVIPGSEGFGFHRHIHSTHFFELADQPIQIVMAVTEAQADLIMDRLRAELVHVFYIKSPVEFGVIGA